MVLMGVVERQGRRRMVLVWLACLCRRCMVSWRRFPLVTWRHSFSSLLPINRPPHRIAKHQDCAYEVLRMPEWLLHGQKDSKHRLWGAQGPWRRRQRVCALRVCRQRWMVVLRLVMWMRQLKDGRLKMGWGVGVEPMSRI
jgi:hypothetical protein